MVVTAIVTATKTLTVVRGKWTTAAAHTAGAVIATASPLATGTLVTTAEAAQAGTDIVNAWGGGSASAAALIVLRAQVRLFREQTADLLANSDSATALTTYQTAAVTAKQTYLNRFLAIP